jgi:hypothetical protein
MPYWRCCASQEQGIDRRNGLRGASLCAMLAVTVRESLHEVDVGKVPMFKGDIVRLTRPVFAAGREVPAGVEGRILEIFACLPSAEVALRHNDETLVLPVTLALLERLHPQLEG